MDKNIFFSYNKSMNKFILEIEYNGKDFSGWQKQPDMRTVQGAIEDAIFASTKQEVEVVGSGRTDAGVHALGQVAHFEIELNLPPEKIKDILNRALPEDVTIKNVKIADMDFHARFSAHKKTYVYKILNAKEKRIFEKDYASREEKPLNESLMQECADMLVGTHNFKGFCSSQTQVQSFERTIYNISVKREGEYILVEVTGNGFLYNMVRILVGTMVDFAQGKLTENDVKTALETGNRAKSGKTMPACGLYLKEVVY